WASEVAEMRGRRPSADAPHPSVPVGRRSADEADAVAISSERPATAHHLPRRGWSPGVEEATSLRSPHAVSARGSPMYVRPSKAKAHARRIRRMLAALTVAGTLATPAAHAAFLPLPANGAQVNDDPVNSIDPRLDAGVSDVVGGAVVAGKVN